MVSAGWADVAASSCSRARVTPGPGCRFLVPSPQKIGAERGLGLHLGQYNGRGVEPCRELNRLPLVGQLVAHRVRRLDRSDFQTGSVRKVMISGLQHQVGDGFASIVYTVFVRRFGQKNIELIRLYIGHTDDHWIVSMKMTLTAQKQRDGRRVDSGKPSVPGV